MGFFDWLKKKDKKKKDAFNSHMEGESSSSRKVTDTPTYFDNYPYNDDDTTASYTTPTESFKSHIEYGGGSFGGGGASSSWDSSSSYDSSSDSSSSDSGGGDCGGGSD